MDLKELELYRCWLANAVDDADLQVELKSIENDEEAINDRFYRDLEFGTGGLRGVIGAGTNRMNIYTIRRATQGLADFVKESYENPSVAISFDSRIKSDVFARAAAEVLAANDKFTYTFTMNLLLHLCFHTQFVLLTATQALWLQQATIRLSITATRLMVLTAVR